MSDDTMNVDSDEELPTGEVLGTDEAASQETTEESEDGKVLTGKEKALKDTEAALKERQAEYTRLSQQLAEQKGQMNALVQLMAQREKQGTPEVKDWMDSINDEEVTADPAKAMKQMVQNMRREIASVLQDRDAFLASKFGSKLDPETQAAVDGLKSDPDFADLPDSKLVAIAKRMGITKKAVMQPRGSFAGSGRGAPVTVKKDGEMSPDMLAYLTAVGAIKTAKRDDTLE